MQTQKQIEEGTIAICKFIGGNVDVAYETHLGNSYVWRGEPAIGFRVKTQMPAGIGILIDQCKFHSSWDWLMPVVEKINYTKAIIDGDEETFDVIIFKSTVQINNQHEMLFESCRMDQNDPMCAVLFRAIVEFINWYNANKTK